MIDGLKITFWITLIESKRRARDKFEYILRNEEVNREYKSDFFFDEDF